MNNMHMHSLPLVLFARSIHSLQRRRRSGTAMQKLRMRSSHILRVGRCGSARRTACALDVEVRQAERESVCFSRRV